MLWLLIIILIVVIVFLFLTVRIVPQTEEYVIEFLGRYHTTWKAGIHVLIPFVERIAARASFK